MIGQSLFFSKTSLFRNNGFTKCRSITCNYRSTSTIASNTVSPTRLSLSLSLNYPPEEREKERDQFVANKLSTKFRSDSVDKQPITIRSRDGPRRKSSSFVHRK